MHSDTDTTIQGYKIHKGTTVTANFWAIHHDPNLWNDPDTFDPERFLSQDGKSVKKSPNFILFSLGKRACPGETMAYIEIFLYFVSMLQKYAIKLPDGVKPSFDVEMGLTYSREPYDIRMIPRI
ncbi:hypothetical protein JTE90_015104 [Oedothorax gibbosus]|uniref:Cytochrome P450 n=1 Tax=Oedothorax gibbosus TaxID=931172 RepID=A0AAV6VRV9_9ARAC|nr:hypothetical protein JTE90_015104 [Oedothorax gibbosus]